jgi:hypothetical protein
MWQKLATRRLSCSPAAGDYADPAAACAAMRDYKSLLRNRTGMCFCAVKFGLDASASGELDGRHVDLALDGCTACGLGGGAQHDLHTLLPTA